MKVLFLISILISVSAYSKTQTITCSQKGRGFYYIQVSLELGPRNQLIEANTQFRGEDLTPGLYSSQYFEGSTVGEYGGVKAVNAGLNLALIGETQNPAYDDPWAWAILISKTALGRSFRKGMEGVYISSERAYSRDENVYVKEALSAGKLKTCWSVVK